MRQLRNRRRSSLGFALVATSKSFGLRPSRQIAHAAADQIGFILGLAKPLNYPGGIGIDLIAPDLHFVSRSMAYNFGQDW